MFTPSVAYMETFPAFGFTCMLYVMLISVLQIGISSLMAGDVVTTFGFWESLSKCDGISAISVS